MSGPRIEAVIEAIRDDTPDVKVIDLRPVDEIDCRAPSGAHVEIELPNGLVRNYSLINQSREFYRIAVKRENAGRGGSKFIHRDLIVGSSVRLCTPRAMFPFVGGARAVMIGGGIGITPLLTHAWAAERSGIPWELYCSYRSKEIAPLLDEALELDRSAQHGKVNVCFTAEGGARLDIRGIIGAVPADTHFYFCGPATMIADAMAAARDVSPSHLHFESFSNDSEIAREGGFCVVLAQSGVELDVPKGSTILDALLDLGIEVDHSCCEGTCGSCEVRVLDGIPDHRDVIQTDEQKLANDRIMICCSGSLLPRLVLDL